MNTSWRAKFADAVGSGTPDPSTATARQAPVPQPAIENKPAPGQKGPSGLGGRTTYSRVNTGLPITPDAGATEQKSQSPRGLEFLPKTASQESAMNTMTGRPPLHELIKSAMAGSASRVDISYEAARQIANAGGTPPAQVKTASAKPAPAPSSIPTAVTTKLANALDYLARQVNPKLAAIELDSATTAGVGPGEGPGSLELNTPPSGENPADTNMGEANEAPPMSPAQQKDPTRPSDPGTGMETNDHMEHGEQPTEPIPNEKTTLTTAEQKLSSAHANNLIALGLAKVAFDAKGRPQLVKVGGTGMAVLKGLGGAAAGGLIGRAIAGPEGGRIGAAAGGTMGAIHGYTGKTIGQHAQSLMPQKAAVAPATGYDAARHAMITGAPLPKMAAAMAKAAAKTKKAADPRPLHEVEPELDTAYNELNRANTPVNRGSTIGTTLGAIGGGVGGHALGELIGHPGLGTAAGAIGGGYLGHITGKSIGEQFGDKDQRAAALAKSDALEQERAKRIALLGHQNAVHNAELGGGGDELEFKTAAARMAKAAKAGKTASVYERNLAALGLKKTAEDAIFPAQISAGTIKDIGPNPPDGASESGEEQPPEPSDVDSQKRMLESSQAAINYTRREAKADPKKDLGAVVNEPALSASKDDVLQRVFEHTNEAGAKIASAQSAQLVQIAAARAVMEKVAQQFGQKPAPKTAAASKPAAKPKKTKTSMMPGMAPNNPQAASGFNARRM